VRANKGSDHFISFIQPMNYTITFYNDSVQAEIMSLPKTLQARYIGLSVRMLHDGPNLGDPHTLAFGDGLFELRLKGAEGIAHVLYCTLVGKRIVMLHSFVKKSQKTPTRERRIAETRLKEIKNADA
jgi:phage-related protein